MVSVIIPVYNREKTIKKAIESVLEQTYTDLEVIIVDDCSTDKTIEVVESIADKRIRLVKSPKNGGACKARNLGIDHANGELIAFQDSDDYWHADKLEKSVHFLKEKDADFVFSALNRKGIRGQEEKNEIVPKYNINKEENKLLKILTGNCVSTQTIVARREIFDKVKFDYKMPRFQDWEFSIQVIEAGFSVYFIKEPLVDCYVQGDSITSDDTKGFYAIDLIEKKYEKYYTRYPEVYGKFCEGVGYFYEMAGKNGSRFYLKAYKSCPSFKNFVRFFLSKIGLFKMWVKIFE